MDNVPSVADIAAVTDKNDGLGGSLGGGFGYSPLSCFWL
jgi:hypothetical protein